MIDLRIEYSGCWMTIYSNESGCASVICKDGSERTTALILDSNELGDLYRALKNHFEPEGGTNG